MKRRISILLALATLLSLFALYAAYPATAEEENVARGKTVMGGGTNLDAVTDGSASSDNYWDGGQIPSYVVIDLDGYYDLTRVNVITYYGDGRKYKFTVSVSDDGIGFTDVGGKDDGEAATAKGTDVSFTATARYLRVTVTYNSANGSAHLVEISAYGTKNNDYIPPEKPTVDENDPDNLAFRKPTRSNSASGLSAAVNDGDDQSAWEAEDYPRYIDVDLMDNYDLRLVKIFFKSGVEQSFKLYGSVDGVCFDRLYESNGYVSAKKGLEITFDAPTTYRILRVSLTGSAEGIRQRASLAEIRVYGDRSETEATATREKMAFQSYNAWLKERCGVDVDAISDANGKYDVRDTYTEADTVEELNGIVTRLLGQRYVSWFDFRTAAGSDPDKDYFRIEDAPDGRIRITGSDGTCVAAGLNWYLKYCCNVHIVQQTGQTKMPDEIVPVGQPVYKDTKLKLRYAYNYCTLSYTMAFYGYDDWRRELDWLYLNGVNLILDTTATEALWVEYLQRLGYNADDAKNYVCGYSFKAWWLMGNLEGYGGSVSDMWINDTLEMARVNQRSMTVMGARPALQTFVGAMPQSFKKIASAHLTEQGYDEVGPYMAPQGGWAGLLTRPNVLRTDYNGYSYLAQLFYECEEYIYGQVSDYFCGDVCHEGGIIPEGLAKEEMAAKILNELMTYNENGVWILQRWWDNPLREVLDGFGAYRTTNILVLDLNTAQTTGNFTDTKKYGAAEFGGTAWILSSLDDYGGNEGMHGSLSSMVSNVMKAKNQSKYLRGMGITPEATQNNPVMYDLYWELVWRDETPDLSGWVRQYVTRRYGAEDENVQAAWKKLLATIYTKGNADDGGPMRMVINGIPKFAYEGGYYIPKYDTSEYFEAIRLLMKSYDKFKDNECFVYDLTDALSTYLGAVETTLLQQMRTIAKKPKAEDAAAFENYAKKFLESILLIDEIGMYTDDELVGRWIGRAYDFMNDERTGEYDDYSEDMMVFNAKCLITAWHSGTLIDYAARRYNGLTADYYYKSWSMEVNYWIRMVKARSRCDTTSYNENMHFKDAWDFINNGKTYRSVSAPAEGDETSRGLCAIWEHIEANYAPQTLLETMSGIGLTSKSKFKLSEGTLQGVCYRSTLEKLKSQLVLPENALLTATDASGRELSDQDVIIGQVTLSLYVDGVRTDTLVVIPAYREQVLYLDTLPFSPAGLIGTAMASDQP